MRLGICAFLYALTLGFSVQAETPTLPADAVQLKGDDIAAYLDGKRFSTIIYDADAIINATVNWDFKKGVVYGDFSMGETKGKFENPLTIKGNTTCGERTAKGALVCQKIFVSGSTMYEVNKAGQVHAVSKIK